MRTLSTEREIGVLKAVARVLWLVPLLCLVLPLATRAEIVKNLYSAQVPVADQSAGALASASRDALAEVLVKVSGSVDVLQYGAIKAALGEARSHVQQYAYVREKGPEASLAARFEFDASYVTGLVTDAGAPLWTANRPLVLVWMVLEDDGGRYFVNWDTAPELSEQLLAAFSRRGVPVQLPLFDLADSAALAPEQVWRLSEPALQAASARYDAQEIMAGRLAVGSTGNAIGDWSYFSAGGRIDRSISAADAESFVREGVSIVAEEMSERYAIAPSAAGDGDDGVSMSVTGVSRYADYAGIVSWLESLELIEHANVERIEGDRIELSLYAQAGAAQLIPIIELNKRLQPLPPAASGSQLNYQWQN